MLERKPAMSSPANGKPATLDLGMGEQRLRLRAEGTDRVLLSRLRRMWPAYESPFAESDFTLTVSSYSQKDIYVWEKTELEAFRSIFESTYNRFPRNAPPSDEAFESLRLLLHIDPHSKHGAMIRQWAHNPRELIHARSGFHQYYLSTASKQGCLCVHKNSRRSLPELLGVSDRATIRMISGIANGIMLALSYLLIHDEGILLHGAAVRKNRRTVAFLGLSGSGKSTAARLCAPDICFSDDVVVLRKEGGEFFVHASPFTQNPHRQARSSNARGRIAALYLLKKHSGFQTSPCAKSGMMRLILLNLIHFFRYLDNDTARKGFDVVRTLLDRVPTFTLKFGKNRRDLEFLWPSQDEGCGQPHTTEQNGRPECQSSSPPTPDTNHR
jgi:hypothetical protein